MAPMYTVYTVYTVYKVYAVYTQYQTCLDEHILRRVSCLHRLVVKTRLHPLLMASFLQYSYNILSRNERSLNATAGTTLLSPLSAFISHCAPHRRPIGATAINDVISRVTGASQTHSLTAVNRYRDHDLGGPPPTTAAVPVSVVISRHEEAVLASVGRWPRRRAQGDRVGDVRHRRRRWRRWWQRRAAVHGAGIVLGGCVAFLPPLAGDEDDRGEGQGRHCWWRERDGLTRRRCRAAPTGAPARLQVGVGDADTDSWDCGVL